MRQIEFAKAIGCSQGYLSRMEQDSKMPSHAQAMRIIKFAKARKIKVKLEELFSE